MQYIMFLSVVKIELKKIERRKQFVDYWKEKIFRSTH